MGKIVAVCISPEKGTRKTPVVSARLIVDHGLEQDAHAGNRHRQVSLLSLERIEEFRQRGALVAYGDFGENLVVGDIDFVALPVGTELACGDILLEITQIGKECHSHCAIRRSMGECIMPTQGVFARVLRGGMIRPGDDLRVADGRKPASGSGASL
jgi:MOSC domain-containing protein YiiM